MDRMQTARRGMSEVNIVAWFAIGTWSGIVVAHAVGAPAWLGGVAGAVLGLVTGRFAMEHSLTGASGLSFWAGVATIWMPERWRLWTLGALLATIWLLIGVSAVRRRTKPG